MKDEILKPWRWLAKHPMKALYILLGAMVVGTVIGAVSPELAAWVMQLNIIDVLSKIAGFLLAIGIALAIVITLLG